MVFCCNLTRRGFVELLRTPDECFYNLPGYDFIPHYVEIDGIRVHYVDEGPEEAEPVLFLHGEPSWSYLYRHMIPLVTAAGYRVIAPDLVGFGRSDKPVQREDYTYQRHVDWMRGVMRALNLQDATLVAQDWGGLIGLRLAAEHPWRFSRIVAANTFLPTGDTAPNEAFFRWQRFSQRTPVFDAGYIVQTGCVTRLPPEVTAAYNAPFPEESYKAGARQFPLLVPTTPDDPAAEANRAAWLVLKRWEKPFLTVFGDQDPVTRGADSVFHKLVPGARGLSHRTIEGAGHFLQEDKGPEFAHIIIEFLKRTPL
jgi:haloalkane dehalogenase